MARRAMTVCLLALCVVLLGVPGATAWWGDEFANDASGQAVYEDMMIHPQAVKGGDGRTYLVYQGPNLDPYAMAVDDAGVWQGPVWIAHNPVADSTRIADTHGAPSLYIDQDGYLHCFYGSHQSRQGHARSARPLDISEWIAGQPAPRSRATYPQPMLDSSGTVSLFHRLDESWNGAYPGSWMRASFNATLSAVATDVPVLAGDDRLSWYAHTEKGANGRIHLVAVPYWRSAEANPLFPYSRAEVYYLYSDPDGVWRDVAGRALASTQSVHGIRYEDLNATGTACAVYRAPGEQQNGVTVADDGSGNPGIVFNSGTKFGPNSCRWVFARWDGSRWATSTVAPTDHLFDSSTLEYTPSGIDAFITTGGGSHETTPTDSYADRGGDIVRFHSADAGTTWSNAETVAAASPSAGVRYNDPQIVLDHGARSRLYFGEWNNDGGNFVHRVFLWGTSGYLQREFFPSIVRADGRDRYAVAARLSEESFPIGAEIAFVVSGAAPADALSAAPLAFACNAPVLLTSGGALAPATQAEIARLRCKQVVIVGGSGSVSAAVASRIRATGAVRDVRRIEGADRYAVAGRVANELADRVGPAKQVFVVNGTAWADALSVAPVAARLGAPILLVERTGVPAATLSALRSVGPSATVVVVGGGASVATSAASAVGARVRLGGQNRYAVSAAVARCALDGTAPIPPAASTSRITVASGEVFSDALAAGVFTVRGRGVMLLTRAGSVPPETSSFLDQRARKVVRVTIAGGTTTIRRSVADEIAELLALHERE